MKKILFLAMVAMGATLSGCNDNQLGGNDNNENGQKGILTVNLKNAPSSRAIGAPTQTEENKVFNFTVYVFNHASGALEESATFTNALQGTLTGINTASKKDVVVLVNLPTAAPAFSNYSDIASHYVSLTMQDPANLSLSGLTMSGEKKDVTISATSNVVTVQVKRLVSKVLLNKLTVSPGTGVDLSKFEITGISMQQVRDKSSIMGGFTTNFSYVGGVTTTSVENPYLYDVWTLPSSYTAGAEVQPNIYFYVFPNDNTYNTPTLMTISGKYNGVAMYYPFVINNKAVSSGGANTDGNLIERNKVYSLNVILKKLGAGSDNPDDPGAQVQVTVEVDVADWDETLVQNAEC